METQKAMVERLTAMPKVDLVTKELQKIFSRFGVDVRYYELNAEINKWILRMPRRDGEGFNTTSPMMLKSIVKMYRQYCEYEPYSPTGQHFHRYTTSELEEELECLLEQDKP